MAFKSMNWTTRQRIVVVCVALLVIGGIIFYFTSVKSSSKSSTTTPNTSFTPKTKTGNQSTKGEAPTPIQPTPSSKGVGTETGGDGTSSTTLAIPTGNFVNTHQPSLTTQMFSSCVTTVGATCQITFTNTSTGNVVPISSQPQAVDSSGSAYWSWSPNQIGLTSGTWKITATATLNNQTQSASDATNLKIQ